MKAASIEALDRNRNIYYTPPPWLDFNIHLVVDYENGTESIMSW